MIQAAKASLLAFFNPKPSQKSSSTRKRRRTEDSPQPSYSSYISPQKKRKRSSPRSRSAASWISSIYNYVMGNSPTITIEDEFSDEDDFNEKLNEPSKYTHTTYTVPSILHTPPLGTRKNRRYERKQIRTPLTQISNKEVLDLTLDDDSDDEIQVIEPKSVKEVIHLTDDSDSDCAIETAKKIFSPNINRKEHSNMINEESRLEELKRYEEIVASYTNLSSPVSLFSPYGDKSLGKQEKSIDSITFSPEKPPVVDLTDESNMDRSKSNDTLHHSSLTSRRFSVGNSHDLSFKDYENKNSMDFSWIDKFRSALDPAQLERERQILAEERRKKRAEKLRLEEIEKLKEEINKNKSKEFVPLTDEMQAKVKEVWKSGNRNEIFAVGFNSNLTRTDLYTLKDSTWLNDEVVNFYFNLIKERNNDAPENTLPKIHVFNTFFFPKLLKTGFAGVKRWTRKIDIFSMDMILIPVHLGLHWVLAVMDMKNKRIEYYDSLKQNNMTCLQALKQYLCDEMNDKKKIVDSFEDWELLTPKDIPQQMNGCDCGVFMCKYAEYRSRNAPFTFTQKNMQYFRRRMVYEIVFKKLL